MASKDRDILGKLSRLVAYFRDFDNRYGDLRLPFKTMKDWQETPIVNKEDFVASLTGNTPQQIFNVTATSGTTASRLVITHSLRSYKAHMRRLVAQYKSIGAREGELCLNLCSYTLNSAGRLMENAYKIAGAGVIPLGSLDSKEKVQEAVDLARMLRPTIVNSYTNQLFDFFSLLGPKHSIRVCVVTGEPLINSFRVQMEKMFGVKIYNHYGSMEFSGFAIAQKSSDEYMKIFDEGLYIEIMKDDGTTSSVGRGAIVITDLENISVPFIRYRLGDRVDIKKRKDGTYIKILGRLSDTILIHGETYAIADIISAAEQILQHPNFFFVIEKDSVSHKDKLGLFIKDSNKERANVLKSFFKDSFPFGSSLRVGYFQGNMPKTSIGKYRHIVDVREHIEKI